MKKPLALLILKLLGWSTENKFRHEHKYIIIGAPHTSNWDFLYFILLARTTGIKIHWIAKHTLFKGPFGKIFKRLGGIPINRQIHNNLIRKMTEEFNKRENFVVAIAPEGTRSKAEYWKTGFYHIARQANIPIVLGFIDYKRKTVGFADTFYPSGNIEEDMKKIRKFYEDKTGKHPSRHSEIKLKDQN